MSNRRRLELRSRAPSFGEWRDVPIVGPISGAQAWYALRVRPGTEFSAARKITQAGYDGIVLPMRREVRVCGRVREMMGAKLSGYVLATTPRWPEARVITLCGHPDGEPAVLPRAAILRLVEAHAPRGAPPVIVREGDAVRITSGPFAGLLAMVRRVMGQHALECTVAAMGSVSVVVQSSAIELAA